MKPQGQFLSTLPKQLATVANVLGILAAITYIFGAMQTLVGCSAKLPSGYSCAYSNIVNIPTLLIAVVIVLLIVKSKLLTKGRLLVTELLCLVIIFMSGYFFLQAFFPSGVNTSLSSNLISLTETSAEYPSSGSSNYSGFCTSGRAVGAPQPVYAQGPLTAISESTNGTIKSYTCNDSPEHWAVTFPYGTNKYICVDDVISNKAFSILGGVYQPGVTVAYEVSQPIGSGTSCTALPLLQLVNS